MWRSLVCDQNDEACFFYGPLGEEDFPGQCSMIRYLESFAGQETIVPRVRSGNTKTAPRPTCGHSADHGSIDPSSGGP